MVFSDWALVFDVFLYGKCGVLNCAHGFVPDYNFLIVIKFLSLSPKKKKVRILKFLLLPIAKKALVGV